MATFSAVTRQHILQAIAEHDSRGADDFLGVYGYPQTTSTFEHEGHRYPAAAILGVAHRYATGRLATADEVHGGDAAALALLGRRGFAVPEAPGSRTAAAPRTRSAAPARTRAAATPARPKKPAAREVELVLCPTCSMALPATGICDYCA